MSKRITYDVWGPRVPYLLLPEYVMVQEHETRLQAVCRSIGKHTGFAIVDCQKVEKGEIVANQYQLTLGTRCHGGGYTLRYEIWISIDIERD